MPLEELFRVGTIEQDTLDSLNAMFTDLFAVGGGGAQTELNTTQIAANVAAIAANLASIAAIELNASASADYPESTSGVQTLLAAATVARRVIIQAHVTEVFANGDGTQPTFTIGDGAAATKFAIASQFTGQIAESVFAFGGVIDANEALIVTAVAGTGTTMTGALRVTALAMAQ